MQWARVVGLTCFSQPQLSFHIKVPIFHELFSRLQRAVCVDIRYVLFVIDKYAGADNLLRELKIKE